MTGLEGATLAVEGEPTLELVRRGVALALEERCDLVIGLGGGSAIDAGKAVAALLSNGGDPLDYLEVVGEGRGLHAHRRLSSRFRPPRAPARKLPATQFWRLPNTASRPACGARGCCRGWRWSIPN